jgi:lysophospholipase L1-like esterase
MQMKKRLLFFIVITLVAFKGEELPNVLIIGDSISIGYTPYVQEALEGRANVVHNEGNAQHTGTGLLKLDEWLGNTRWDVIHFNWGLWDLCYRSEQSKVYGNRDKINGNVTFTPEEYEKNLEQLVMRLKQTHAKLIFATTTYVPKGEAGRFFGDDKRYNKVAVRIMKKHNIQINKLNAGSRKIHKKYKKEDGDVHFTSEGYELLARQVARKILKNVQ